MGTSYDIALFGHLLGVLLFTAGIAIAAMAYEIARRLREPDEIAAVLKIARAGVPLVLLGALMVLGFGSWLVDLAGWSYGTGWVSASMTLFLVALILGSIGGRKPKLARLHATKLAAGDQPADSTLNELINDRFSRVVNYASTLALLVVLALMVFKP